MENKFNELSNNCPCIENAGKHALEAMDVFLYKIERAIKKIKYGYKAKKLAKAKEKEDSVVYGV